MWVYSYTEVKKEDLAKVLSKYSCITKWIEGAGTGDIDLNNFIYKGMQLTINSGDWSQTQYGPLSV